MSWAIDHTGTAAGVAKAVTEDLDKSAASYKGKPEADDIEAVKARILAILPLVDLTDPGAHVRVQANGSNSNAAEGIYAANFGCQITRVFLKT
jgi:hypothetical protein